MNSRLPYSISAVESLNPSDLSDMVQSSYERLDAYWRQQYRAGKLSLKQIHDLGYEVGFPYSHGEEAYLMSIAESSAPKEEKLVEPSAQMGIQRETVPPGLANQEKFTPRRRRRRRRGRWIANRFDSES